MEDIVTCYLCGRTVDSENWCFGCKHYICEDHPCDPWGSHDPVDHTGEEVEE